MLQNPLVGAAGLTIALQFVKGLSDGDKKMESFINGLVEATTKVVLLLWPESKTTEITSPRRVDKSAGGKKR